MRAYLLIPGGFVLSVLASATVSLVLPADWRAVAVGGAVAVYALWSRSALAGLATGLMAWCFVTGFVVNAAGELTFAAPDLVRMLVFLAVGLVGGVPELLKRLHALLNQPLPQARRPRSAS